MGELATQKQVVQHVFKQFDTLCKGELTPIQVQTLHGDLRMGGISLPQVMASMKYCCVTDHCHESELYDLLQEMDRRYYLIQDFRWEFSLLDRFHKDTITQEEARWMVQAVHGKHFSQKKWKTFIKSRPVPGSGVSFAEIEVMLCDIPSRIDLRSEQLEDEREKEERLRRQKLLEDEKERLKKLRDEERQRQEEERRRQEEEKRKRLLEDEEVLQVSKVLQKTAIVDDSEEEQTRESELSQDDDKPQD